MRNFNPIHGKENTLVKESTNTSEVFANRYLSEDKKPALFSTNVDQHYTVGKQIGQGAYAVVKLVTNKVTQSQYAMKIYEKYKLSDPMKRKAVQREIAVLKRLAHPNVVRLVELIDCSRQMNLVMDYVNGTSLYTALKK